MDHDGEAHLVFGAERSQRGRRVAQVCVNDPFRRQRKRKLPGPIYILRATQRFIDPREVSLDSSRLGSLAGTVFGEVDVQNSLRFN